MSKELGLIDDALKSWLLDQHIFFVATAPLSDRGHVNCSPKGGDCFRVLGPKTAAYQDYTGSGAETSAHVRENGRIVLMFCAFEGGPKIVRLHGRGRVVSLADPEYADLSPLFPPNPGTRAIVHIDIARVSSSCGYAVPFMDYRSDRDSLDKWAANKGTAALEDYRRQNNSTSIDGLAALATEP